MNELLSTTPHIDSYRRGIMLNRLKNLSTTHLCDAYVDARLLSNEIKPISKCARMIGKVFTIRTDGDLLPVVKGLELAEAGSVLVIDTCKSPYAFVGELFASASIKKKLAGIVVDGACRDIDAIRNLELPIFAKSICAKAGTKSKAGKTQVELELSGIKVRPGEIMIGDENGLVVLSDKELAEIIDSAEAIQQKEDRALKAIRDGKNFIELFNFDEHYNNILLGKTSTFTWKI
ncbi:MAG: RraA family protein [Coxiellaceae bacterium]|nr:RraA family protein [Coxiellaceae bacterium]